MWSDAWIRKLPAWRFASFTWLAHTPTAIPARLSGEAYPAPSTRKTRPFSVRYAGAASQLSSGADPRPRAAERDACAGGGLDRDPLSRRSPAEQLECRVVAAPHQHQRRGARGVGGCVGGLDRAARGCGAEPPGLDGTTAGTVRTRRDPHVRESRMGRRRGRTRPLTRRRSRSDNHDTQEERRSEDCPANQARRDGSEMVGGTQRSKAPASQNAPVKGRGLPAASVAGQVEATGTRLSAANDAPVNAKSPGDGACVSFA